MRRLLLLMMMMKLLSIRRSDSGGVIHAMAGRPLRLRARRTQGPQRLERVGHRGIRRSIRARLSNSVGPMATLSNYTPAPPVRCRVEHFFGCKSCSCRERHQLEEIWGKTPPTLPNQAHRCRQPQRKYFCCSAFHRLTAAHWFGIASVAGEQSFWESQEKLVQILDGLGSDSAIELVSQIYNTCAFNFLKMLPRICLLKRTPSALGLRSRGYVQRTIPSFPSQRAILLSLQR